MKKKFYSIIVTLLMLLFVPVTIQSTTAKAKTFSGKCGKQARWVYNTKTKNLTIKGKGCIDKKIIIKDPASKRTSFETNVIKIHKGITDISSNQPFSKVVCRDSVWLPKTIKKLRTGSLCFASSYLSAVILPKNIKKIETGAFFSPDGFSRVYLDSKNKYYCVKEHVLYTKNKKELVYYPSSKQNTTFRIPKSVAIIRPLAFAGNLSLKKVILPKKIKKIGGGAFFYCKNLSYINLKSDTKIKSLPDYDATKNDLLHSYDDSAEDVSKTTSKKEAHYYHYGVFEYTALKSIVIPDSITTLPPDTFNMNQTYAKHPNDGPGIPEDGVQIPAPIQSITIGKNFTGDINSDNLSYSSNSLVLYPTLIKKIVVNKANPKYCSTDNTLFSKDMTTLYQIAADNQTCDYIVPQNVKRIAHGAFMRHTLTTLEYFNVTINHDMESIDDAAFYKSDIGSITINSHIKRIGKYAFSQTQLYEFICNGTIDSLESHALPYKKILTKLVLPDSFRLDPSVFS